jgi:hypothetical protein
MNRMRISNGLNEASTGIATSTTITAARATCNRGKSHIRIHQRTLFVKGKTVAIANANARSHRNTLNMRRPV